MYVRAGSQLLTSVNIDPQAGWLQRVALGIISPSFLFARGWEENVREAIRRLPGHLQVLRTTLSPDAGNVQLVVLETIDRNDSQDIASDLAIAFQSLGFTVRGYQAAVIVPGPAGNVGPGTVPGGAGNTDSYHESDTVVGNTFDFYLKGIPELIGDQLKGIGSGILRGVGMESLNLDPTLVGVGVIGLIALLVMKK